MTEEGEQVKEIKELVDLPLSRVKRIMKSDSDVKLISQEAVVLTTKAAELLIEHVAENGYKNSNQEGRKTLQYKDLAFAVKEHEYFDFLYDILPEKKLKNPLYPEPKS
eukprot:gb/GECH01004676.1/.p1 GENE.gb/GECH01004676.1/~~gb/GECH01004676.1/.p1  ORF type:complete len:108 (+),score=35.62 gb/GECH01004676.1/:1-324(+)